MKVQVVEFCNIWLTIVVNAPDISQSYFCVVRAMHNSNSLALGGPRPKDFARLLFPRGFLSRLARRTKRKREGLLVV